MPIVEIIDLFCNSWVIAANYVKITFVFRRPAMRKLLVCQHVPHEILGTLNPLLKHAGFRIRYVNFGRHPDAQPSLDGYNGLVILGGPMSAYDDQRFVHLSTEMKLIEAAMQRNLPVLGICL